MRFAGSGARGLVGAVLLSAVASPVALRGQQYPPTGCGACVGAGHGPSSSSIPIFRILGGPQRITELRVPINLPPPPNIQDVGAIEASTRIVLGRNRKLRESLAVAAAAAHPPNPAVNPPEGEVVIRIASIHAPPPSRREDIPRDAFEAIPLRRVAYPRWVPREH